MGARSALMWSCGDVLVVVSSVAASSASSSPASSSSLSAAAAYFFFEAAVPRDFLFCFFLGILMVSSEGVDVMDAVSPRMSLRVA